VSLPDVPVLFCMFLTLYFKLKESFYTDFISNDPAALNGTFAAATCCVSVACCSSCSDANDVVVSTAANIADQ